MKGLRTDRVLTAFRIGDPDGVHPIYDSEGARLYPGRWNTPASPVIYTSEHYSTAMLEKLAHANGLLPPNQHYIRITIPNGTSYEASPQALYAEQRFSGHNVNIGVRQRREGTGRGFRG